MRSQRPAPLCPVSDYQPSAGNGSESDAATEWRLPSLDTDAADTWRA